jgi:predicted 2-oxoglutarate/Fe(II)-dependent dioxygenase YbiX
MNQLSHFRELGVFVLESFLDPALCRKLRGEMAAARKEPGAVGTSPRVDFKIRRVSEATVSAENRRLIRDRLHRLSPTLARYFHARLADFEAPLFHVYGPRGFYRPHYDRMIEGGNVGVAEYRRVSVVLFLNSASKSGRRGGYSGGGLVLYGLLPDPSKQSVGHRVKGRMGMLVAFRSTLLHEVEPVVDGTRYTASTVFGSRRIAKPKI